MAAVPRFLIRGALLAVVARCLVACGDGSDPGPDEPSATIPADGMMAGTGGVAGTSGEIGAVAGVGARSGGAPIDMRPDAGSGGASVVMGGDAGSDDSTVTTEDLVVAPKGSDTAPGTLAEPTTLASAITRITAGHTIFVRGGSYTFAVQVSIGRDNSGSDGKLKKLFAYADEKPVLDFSPQAYASSGNPRGLQIDGSYWHVKGLTAYGSADNGIYVAGNDNVIEGCITHGNRDTGLQLGRYSSTATDASEWPSRNLILNCESCA